MEGDDFLEDNNELQFDGRLVISGPRNPADGIDQYIIGGSLICKSGQPVTKSDGWEMIECVITIKPKKIHRKLERESLKNGRVDHLIMTLGNDEDWGGTEEF